VSSSCNAAERCEMVCPGCQWPSTGGPRSRGAEGQGSNRAKGVRRYEGTNVRLERKTLKVHALGTSMRTFVPSYSRTLSVGCMGMGGMN
jgi:hypothetical protein